MKPEHDRRQRAASKTSLRCAFNHNSFGVTYAASMGLAESATSRSASGPSFSSRASVSARRSSQIIAGDSGSPWRSTGSSVQPIPSTPMPATSSGSTPALRDDLPRGDGDRVPPGPAVNLRPQGLGAINRVGVRRLGNAPPGLVPEHGLRARRADVDGEDVAARHHVTRVSRSHAGNGPVLVPQVLPAASALPQEDLPLDEPAAPVGAGNGLPSPPR